MDQAAISYWPFVVLGISVAFIVLAITKLKMHAFLALIVAGLLAGWLTQHPDEITLSKHLISTFDKVTTGFGATAGSIGVVIALAAIIGTCLMESGAADQIVRRFMRWFGEERGGVALLFAGFFLSIPVFFDTVFFLLVPLARALSLRAGKNYMFYVMAIGGGGALTHSIVPPTPGPLLVGNELGTHLGIDLLGASIIAGLLAGILPAISAYYLAKWLDTRVPVSVRAASGESVADLESIIAKKDDELPSFWVSILPVVLPVVLISLASFLDMAGKKMPGLVESFGQNRFDLLQGWASFFGNKIFAMMMGAFIAMVIHVSQAKLSWEQLTARLGPSFETAGVIILITSAGGAFGAMIRGSGVGETLKAMGDQGFQMSFILLAWLVTAIIRVAQGSATVSMITGSAIMISVIGDGSILPYHPIYIYLAIGFGSMILSWMNDSGFWVVGKLSGFTEKQTLKSWTVMTTMLSVVGLVEILIAASILPLK